MKTGIIPFAISVLMSFIVWNKIIATYFWQRIQGLEIKKAVKPILFLHSFRFGGLAFLVPGAVAANLNSDWAYHAATGDLIAAVLAFTALSLINHNNIFKVILWIFNIWGILDLIVAAIQGVFYNVVPSLGATYFILVIYVPLLFLTHILSFRLLLKNKK